MPGTERERPPVRLPRPDLLFVPDSIKEEGYVYHWMNCSPTQHGDHNVYLAQFEGWEPVEADDKTVPLSVLNRAGMTGSSPGGTSVIKRGDLILYKMKREDWEKNVHSYTEAALNAAETTLDTMVMQANDNAAKRLRETNSRYRIPRQLVFREDVGDPTD